VSELDRYLLTSERSVATARRHWAVLLPQIFGVTVAWIACLWVVSASTNEYVNTVGTFFFLFSFLWISWLVAEWYMEQFAITDKRVLLVTGLLYKKVAVMPLSKVTDMTYERSPVGRMLGFGTFVMESAGQDQALSRIDYVRDPERLYFQLSEELFGPAAADNEDDVPPHLRRPHEGGTANTTPLPRLP
jgi:membrane protein YdbS with pleckstrin-like domain